MNKLTFNRIMGLPKSIYFNFKYLPFKQAKKLPVRLGQKVKLEINKKANIVIDNDSIYKGMIQIGVGYGSYRSAEKACSSLIMREDSELVFKGAASIEKGARIQIDEAARIEIGDLFIANYNFLMYTKSEITIGKRVMLGWDVTILGTDGHIIYDIDSNEAREKDEKIIIKDHTWLCAKVSILKGTTISENSVVGYGTILSGNYRESNSVVYGYNEKRIIERLNWRSDGKDY